MSDSGNLTIKFESNGSNDFSGEISNFCTKYEKETYTRVEFNSLNNSFNFYFDRCWHFNPEVLVECSKGLNVIINAVYEIWGDGTDPIRHYKVHNGMVDYQDNEHVDIEDLRE